MEPYLPVLRDSGVASGMAGAPLLERPRGQGFLFLLDRLMRPSAPSPRSDGRAPEETPAPSLPLPPESASLRELPLSERTEAMPVGSRENEVGEEDPSDPGPSPEGQGVAPFTSLPWIYAASLESPTPWDLPPSEAQREVNDGPASLPAESLPRAGRAPILAGGPFGPEGGQLVDAELPAQAGPAPGGEQSATVPLPGEAGIQKEGNGKPLPKSDGPPAAIREPKGVPLQPKEGQGWPRLEPELQGEIWGEIPREQDRTPAHFFTNPPYPGDTQAHENGRVGAAHQRDFRIKSPISQEALAEGLERRQEALGDQGAWQEPLGAPGASRPGHGPDPFPIREAQSAGTEGIKRGQARTRPTREGRSPEELKGTGPGKASAPGQSQVRESREDPRIRSPHSLRAPRPMDTDQGISPVPRQEDGKGDRQSVDAELPAGEGAAPDREGSATVPLPSEAGIQKEGTGGTAAPPERIRSVLDALKAVSQSWRGEPLPPGMAPGDPGQPDLRDLLPQESEPFRLGSQEPLPEGNGPPAAILDPEEISLQPEEGRVWLKLEPERLGEIRGEIALEQDRLQARFFTESPMAKEALEGSLEQLKQALRDQGLRLEQFSVTVEPDGRHALHEGLASFRHSGGEGNRGRQEAGQQEAGERPRESRSPRIEIERSRVDLFA
ncbi:MAG: flagellar hook-length control protein FliK [Candidatus Tectomicrobia bacterium]|uniref:Flagellar hook-length control protein FliK n=1 Tax=Tectimicrobiota bacterium TaxID=2528274 RepID=A0A932CQZ2_UNCTE|nr:flagellar hook-length control protein FliK [Candidatus Tectomicrobia bacterium]